MNQLLLDKLSLCIRLYDSFSPLANEVPDALFFLGVLFAVGGLERVGLLKEFAVQLSALVPWQMKNACNLTQIQGPGVKAGLRNIINCLQNWYELIMWWFKDSTSSFAVQKGSVVWTCLGIWNTRVDSVTSDAILIDSSIRGALWCPSGHLFGLCLGSSGQCAIGGSGSGNVAQIARLQDWW